MRRDALLIAILTLSAALPLAAWPQQQESLGDLARQIRAQHDKDTAKAVKVFTNDNLPAPKPGEPVNSTPTPPVPATHLSNPDQTSSKPVTTVSVEQNSGNPPESPEDKTKTRDDWQEEFKAARKDLASAKEAQQLSEDELNLLQIQQAREMDPTAKADLTAKVQDKQSEVDVNKATTEAAQKRVDDLEKEFKESGAPEDWSQTD